MRGVRSVIMMDYRKFRFECSKNYIRGFMAGAVFGGCLMMKSFNDRLKKEAKKEEELNKPEVPPCTHSDYFVKNEKKEQA